MYTLFSGLYRYLTIKDEYNVLILGLDNAGKTVSPINLINFNIKKTDVNYIQFNLRLI